MRALGDNEFVRHFVLYVGDLKRQLGAFRGTAEVRAVIHTDPLSAIIAMRANGLEGSTDETGLSFETGYRVQELVDALAGHRPELTFLVTAFSRRMPPRCLSPRSVVASGAGGAVAEIHADLWRFKRLDDANQLRLEVDLDAPHEIVTRHVRNEGKPIARIGGPR